MDQGSSSFILIMGSLKKNLLAQGWRQGRTLYLSGDPLLSMVSSIHVGGGGAISHRCQGMPFIEGRCKKEIYEVRKTGLTEWWGMENLQPAHFIFNVSLINTCLNNNLIIIVNFNHTNFRNLYYWKVGEKTNKVNENNNWSWVFRTTLICKVPGEKYLEYYEHLVICADQAPLKAEAQDRLFFPDCLTILWKVC